MNKLCPDAAAALAGVLRHGILIADGDFGLEVRFVAQRDHRQTS